MSQASVLYDVPGPATRRRHRVYGVIFTVVLLGLLAWLVIALNDKGEFDVIPDLFQSNILKAIGQGLTETLKAAGISIVLAVVLGFALATGRLSDHAWVSRPFWAFTEFFRAVPVLLMMIFLNRITGGHNLDNELRGLIAVVGGLTLYNGSVLAEVFRAGVLAVPKGQSEAAYAIGMRKGQVMRIVLLPQAVRYMLPSIISQCVVALKDTSLGFIVLYPELLRQSKLIAQFVGNNLMVYVFAAIIYIVLNNIVSGIAELLERRMRRQRKGPIDAVEQVQENASAGA